MIEIDEVLRNARTKAVAGDLLGAAAVLDAAPAGVRTGSWHYARGAMARQLGKTDEAITHFEAAVAAEPEIAEYRSNLGAALLDLAKRGDEMARVRALKQLELAAQWGAKLPEVYVNLSVARLISDDFPGALAAADVALRIDENNVPALYNRAAALNAMQQYAKCIETLDTLLTISPGFAPAVQSRANTLLKLRSS